MTTEKELAVHHPGFWRSILPLSDSFVRNVNRTLERYAQPLVSTVAASRRGLVNEGGFRLFAASIETSTAVARLSPAAIETAWSTAVDHIRTLRQFSRTPIDPEALAGEVAEAATLAKRIDRYFSKVQHGALTIEPAFRGCGWVSEARGDVLAEGTLYEIKAGERHFRSIDLHQLLTYCALNFAAKTFDITTVGLLNPRVGTFITVDLDTLCLECAGSSVPDVLNDILSYICEPLSNQHE